MSTHFDSHLEKARQLMDQGASDEELLSFFRQSSASMMESVKLIRQLKMISLKEAQDLVARSDTWMDNRESHEQLQESFARALRQLGQESDT
jgi:ribosomal protein L7/L12